MAATADAAGSPGPMVPRVARVIARRRETEDTWTLELDRGGDGSWEPGQFNMLYAFGVGEVPISIAGHPRARGPLVHTVRDVGAATAAICRAEPGAELGVRGPFGSAWPLDSAAGGDLVIVAGGLGLAPLRPALLAALDDRDRFGHLALLYGGREPEQLLYRDQLPAWAGREDLQLHLTVDSATPGWVGRVGVVTELVGHARFDPAGTTAFVCGPETMMRFTVTALLDAGMEPSRVFVSLERNMKCAVTHCGRCQLGPSFACREGPVYRHTDVAPFLAVREL